MSAKSALDRPDFERLATRKREFAETPRTVVGPLPTIAITPVADGRVGAYEDNVPGTWELVAKVFDLIADTVKLPTALAFTTLCSVVTCKVRR